MLVVAAPCSGQRAADGVGAGRRSSAALSVLQAVPAALLAGTQRWREAWLPGLVTGVATVPAVVVALELGGGISGLFAVEAVAVFINLRVDVRAGPPAGSRAAGIEPAPVDRSCGGASGRSRARPR